MLTYSVAGWALHGTFNENTHGEQHGEQKNKQVKVRLTSAAATWARAISLTSTCQGIMLVLVPSMKPCSQALKSVSWQQRLL